MGVSVLSGALTSLGAAVLLMLCEIRALAVVGRLLFFTLSATVLNVLGLFVTLVTVVPS